MSGAAETSTRPTRRTQAERTAETRARIVEACIACIGELGFQRTTATEITRRAGVTWGAVQHQFGDKDGILRAVLEDSFARFAERLAGMPGRDAPLEERVRAFVDRAWDHFGSAHYRSTFEILLSADGLRDGDPPIWQGEMFQKWNEIWSGVFEDAPHAAAESVALQRFTIAALTGIAALRMLEDTGRGRRIEELELLKATLLGALSPQESVFTIAR